MKFWGKRENNFWRNIEDKLRSDELFQKKVGIIGFGRIGKNILNYSNVFGMQSIIYDPNVKKNNYNLIKNLKRIKNECELIFICINLNKKNINFIDKNFF